MVMPARRRKRKFYGYSIDTSGDIDRRVIGWNSGMNIAAADSVDICYYTNHAALGLPAIIDICLQKPAC